MTCAGNIQGITFGGRRRIMTKVKGGSWVTIDGGPAGGRDIQEGTSQRNGRGGGGGWGGGGGGAVHMDTSFYGHGGKGRGFLDTDSGGRGPKGMIFLGALTVVGGTGGGALQGSE